MNRQQRMAFNAILSRHDNAPKWDTFGADLDVARLILIVKELDKDLEESRASEAEAWQRVNDANRESGILLHTEMGCADTWARINRALYGQQREGDLTYRKPKTEQGKDE